MLPILQHALHTPGSEDWDDVKTYICRWKAFFDAVSSQHGLTQCVDVVWLSFVGSTRTSVRALILVRLATSLTLTWFHSEPVIELLSIHTRKRKKHSHDKKTAETCIITVLGCPSLDIKLVEQSSVTFFLILQLSHPKQERSPRQDYP